jgi:hypothetical protein
LHVLWDFGTTL